MSMGPWYWRCLVRNERRSLQDQVPEEPADGVPEVLRRRPKRQRDRSWERRQRRAGNVVTYRGVPEELHEEIKAVAAGLGVNVGEVARAFLEHGLAAYRSGALELDPVAEAVTRTLYPST